ncbi:MAG: DUF1549 and DUF1553 domain-containing protein [Planctomycetales bacterium]
MEFGGHLLPIPAVPFSGVDSGYRGAATRPPWTPANLWKGASWKTFGLRMLWLATVAAISSRAVAGEAPSPPTFGIDVMAALSKAGCNQGVCHGNKYGKGGFKLSLRGDDPQADFETLTRELSGRRANRIDAERSLLLLKPSMQIPHEGGRRFTVEAPEYRILREWIAEGMPADPPTVPSVRQVTVQPEEAFLLEPISTAALTVTAHFSDGTVRDVTRQATYELSSQIAQVDSQGVVQRREFGELTIMARFVDRQAAARIAFVPARPDFSWNGPMPVNFIDEQVFEKLRTLRINPAPRCDDRTFVRRATLDLVGLLPTAEEARRFVTDGRPDKRERLIDELLERPEFADWWALKWGDLLRNEEKTLDRKGVHNFHAWIRQCIAQGVPLDRFARELIAARGSTYLVPAANYWRAMREPLRRAESTAQVFLGVRLQCAKCHNHPFDRWTQSDYYGWSNLFARVSYRILENRRRDQNDSHEFDGEQVVYMARKGEVLDPRSGAPAPARFLEDGAVPLAEEVDRLHALATWLTAPDNRLFVQTQANRIWYHLLGRGIVNPIDDFRATNPPSHPKLLAALGRELVEHRFDLRHLIRTIMNSHTYQASAGMGTVLEEQGGTFSHATVQRLAAEPLLDALSQVSGAPLHFAGFPPGMRAGELPGVRAERERDSKLTGADQFLRLFGKPPRLQACECERTSDPTLSQAFQLVSGELINRLLTESDNRLGRMIAGGKSDTEIVEELYWTALARPPNESELAGTMRYLATPGDRRGKLEDVLWGLLNAQEFLYRR